MELGAVATGIVPPIPLFGNNRRQGSGSRLSDAVTTTAVPERRKRSPSGTHGTSSDPYVVRKSSLKVDACCKPGKTRKDSQTENKGGVDINSLSDSDANHKRISYSNSAGKQWPRGCLLVSVIVLLWMIASTVVSLTAWFVARQKTTHYTVGTPLGRYSSEGIDQGLSSSGGGDDEFPLSDEAAEQFWWRSRELRQSKKRYTERRLMKTFGLLPLMPVLELERFEKIKSVILPVNADQTVQRLYQIDMVERTLVMQDVEPKPATERRRRRRRLQNETEGSENDERIRRDSTAGENGEKREGRRGGEDRRRRSGDSETKRNGMALKRNRGSRPDMTYGRREKWQRSQGVKNETEVKHEAGPTVNVIEAVEGSGSLPLRALAITEGERLQLSGLSAPGRRSGRKLKKPTSQGNRYLYPEDELPEDDIVESKKVTEDGQYSDGDGLVEGKDEIMEQQLIADEAVELYKPPIILNTYLQLSMGHKLILSTYPYGGALHDAEGKKLRAFDFGPYAKILRKVIESAEYEGTRSQLPSEMILMASHLGVLRNFNQTLLTESKDLPTPPLSAIESLASASRVRRSTS